MKRFDRNIRARDAALEKRPEILKPVGMHATVNVLNGVVNNLMRVVRSESAIGEQGIGVESRTSFYMLANLRLQFMLLAIRYDGGANLPATFQDAHDGSLVLRARSGDAALAFANVHVARLATDERHVNF